MLRTMRSALAADFWSVLFTTSVSFWGVAPLDGTAGKWTAVKCDPSG